MACLCWLDTAMITFIVHTRITLKSSLFFKVTVRGLTLLLISMLFMDLFLSLKAFRMLPAHTLY